MLQVVNSVQVFFKYSIFRSKEFGGKVFDIICIFSEESNMDYMENKDQNTRFCYQFFADPELATESKF